MSKIAELRASLKTVEVKNPELDFEWISDNMKNAIDDILAKIKANPDEKHYHDIYFGSTKGFTYPENYERYLEAFKKHIVKADDSLIAVESQYSNLGDPYFMGKENERVAYYIRIKEK